MTSFEEFLKWEQASQDTIVVKRIYIDIAGDLVAGILLSQIIYWHLPGKGGGAKLRVEHEGKLWLAKGREDWWDECRITPKQFDRAVKILQEKGLIEKKIFRFDGSPTVHIRLIPEQLIDRVNSILTKGENRSLPKGKIDLDERGKTLTYTTTYTTTNTTNKPTKEFTSKRATEEQREERSNESQVGWLVGDEFPDVPDVSAEDLADMNTEERHEIASRIRDGAAVIEYYRRIIGELSPLQIHELEERWLQEKDLSPELIAAAINETAVAVAKRGISSPGRYLYAILREWSNAGKRTLDDLHNGRYKREHADDEPDPELIERIMRLRKEAGLD